MVSGADTIKIILRRADMVCGDAAEGRVKMLVTRSFVFERLRPVKGNEKCRRRAIYFFPYRRLFCPENGPIVLSTNKVNRSLRVDFFFSTFNIGPGNGRSGVR